MKIAKPNKTRLRNPKASAIKNNVLPAEMNPVSEKRLNLILGVAIALIGFLIYANSIPNEYTLDDFAVLKDNKVVTQGLSGIPTLLRTEYFYGFWGSNDISYRPLSLVMFAIEWHFFPNNPHLSHFVNVFLYALSGLLLFLTLSKLLRQQNAVIPFITTLLFITHPVHTEVVANIKGRDEILSFLFLISSIFTVLNYIRQKGWHRLLIAVILYFLALLSKENAITFLAVIPLMIYFFTDIGILSKKSLLICGSFIAMGLVYILLRAQILGILTIERGFIVLDNTLVAASDFGSRLATAIYILSRYIQLLFFPHPLVYDYSYSQISLLRWNDVRPLFSAIIHLGLLVYAIIKMREKSILSFAIFFYLITLSLVSNIFFLIGSTMAERFLYMPSLGFCLIMTMLLAKLSRTDIIRPYYYNLNTFFKGSKILFMIVSVIVLLYSAKTISRNPVWKNNLTLYRHDVNSSPNSARTHYFYAVELLTRRALDEKDQVVKNKLLDEVIKELQTALKILPSYTDVYGNLGMAYYWRGDYNKALENLQLAKKHNPNKPKVYNSLGLAYYRTGKFKDAIENLREAIRLDSSFSEAYNNIGSAYFGNGQYAEAIQSYKKAVELDSSFVDGYSNLANSYGTMQQYDSAISYFNKVLALKPEDAQTYYLLGMTYQYKGDTVNARQYLDQASRLNGKSKK